MFSPQSYDSVRQGAAVARRVDRGVIRVNGADATSWLQGLLTNDVETLPPVDPASGVPGEARYSAYLTPQGRMITDMRVLRLASSRPTADSREQTLMDVPSALAASLTTSLDALIFAEDAQVEDASQAIVVLEVHGPRAPAIVSSLLASGAPGIVAAGRDDRLGVPGYVIYAGAADEASLTTALLDAGALAIDLDTLDVVRIEAGRPAFLVDMDTDTIPLEAGIEDRAISFTKGCYVGQEIIVRVTQRGGGRVAKKLVGLDLGANGGAGGASPALPRRGATIRAGDRDVGRMTSAAFSPTLGRAIALGYVHRDFVQPGTAVRIVSEGSERDATVAETPFVPSVSVP